jgi:hypothetical protein
LFQAFGVYLKFAVVAVITIHLYNKFQLIPLNILIGEVKAGGLGRLIFLTAPIV